MENKPRFRKVEIDHAHFLRIGFLINERLKDLPEHYSRHSPVKILFFPLLYLILYLISLYYRTSSFVMVIMYACMGITGIFIFLNLFHEATHGLLLKSIKGNRKFLYLFDLVGPNSFIWIKRHNRLHHNYPNIKGWDSDIEESGPIQISPHQIPRKHTGIQHIYIFFLYPFYLFNWIFIRDFRDFFQPCRVAGRFHPIPPIEYIKLFFFKILFFGYTVVLPVCIGVPLWQALLSLLSLLVAGSALAMLVLLTPHVNAGNKFPEISADGQINSSWFMHQLMTTNDVWFNNRIAGSIMGNFHCHVVHHLFPNISYLHAPGITEILKEYAKGNDLPYKRYALIDSLKLHYKLVRQHAIKATEIFSEVM